MARKTLAEILNGKTQFGRLTVLEEVEGIPNPGNGTIRRVRCLCECGQEKTFLLQNVKQGKSNSCGCLTVEVNREMRLKHGDSRSRTTGETAPEYAAHQNMLNRCYNPKVSNYAIYGGRGISVCQRWRGDGGYERFICDLGPRPSADHSIQQARNTRRKQTLNYRGRDVHVAELAESAGIHPDTLSWRLKVGWDVEEAISAPVGSRYGPRPRVK